jgi:dihydrofolate synthase/folylpolyglutamate synthase
MALDYFHKAEVEYAVIETGMGGRLDSTNVITPLLSVITNISYDHMQYLGDTLGKISAEKAGIIKSSVPVVVGEFHPNTFPVFENTAKRLGSEIHLAESLVSISSTKEDVLKLSVENTEIEFQPDLKGAFQKRNFRTALAAWCIFSKNNPIVFSSEIIKRSFEEVISLTGLKGRWQILQKKPMIVCDTAHNEAGIKEAMAQLRKQKPKQLHIVFGMVKDKDHDLIVALLPKEANYYLAKPDIIRGLEVENLSAIFKKHGLSNKCYASITEAINAAKNNLEPEDVLFIGGSTFVVSEIPDL